MWRRLRAWVVAGIGEATTGERRPRTPVRAQAKDPKRMMKARVKDGGQWMEEWGWKLGSGGAKERRQGEVGVGERRGVLGCERR
jgi:hypothetical protein